MAIAAHCAMLRRGVDAWNQWREDSEHRKVPDLSGVNLSHRDLREADFHAAEFDEEVVGPANAWAGRFEDGLAELRRKCLPWQAREKLAKGKTRPSQSKPSLGI